MIEEIRRKLKDNYDCNLSIEELKVLYGIDYPIIKDLNIYRWKRNKCIDFNKMFDKKYIANNKNEIDENTICYTGNELEINEILPTYNLKYICGYLLYRLDTIYNLENLEIVYSDILFSNIKEFNCMDNLRCVMNTLSFYNCTKIDLSNLEYIHNLSLGPLLKDANNVSFPLYVDNLWLPYLINSNGLILPKYLENLYISKLSLIKGIYINPDTKVYVDEYLVNRKILDIVLKRNKKLIKR